MWPNPRDTADLVTFTEEIVNGKLHVLCGGACSKISPDLATLLYLFKSLKSEKLSSQFFYD